MTNEVAVLREWKRQALVVMAGLDRLGPLLGVPLGTTVTGDDAADAALDLRNERDAARAEVEVLKDRLTQVATDIAAQESCASVAGACYRDHDGCSVGESLRIARAAADA